MVKLYTITYNAETGDGEPDALSDARLYDALSAGNGLVEGCAATLAGGTQIHLTSGWGIIMGRVFEVPEQDIDATPASTGTQAGRLYLKLNLAAEGAAATLETIAAETLPQPLQEDINDNGTVYELPLWEYTVTALAASDLVQASPHRAKPAGWYAGTLSVAAEDWTAGAAGEVMQDVVLAPINGARPLQAGADIVPGVAMSDTLVTNAALVRGFAVVASGVLEIVDTNTLRVILPASKIPVTDIPLVIEGRNL